MGKLSRRDFIEDALIAATLAATAGGMGQTAWAEPNIIRRKVGPNDKIRMACIGVKSRGMSHVDAYAQMPDVDIVAICDCDLGVVGPAVKAATHKGAKPEPKVVQDLRRIMDDKEIDAVSIATPNHWHSLAAIWAMQSGKDVYVEKPVSHNVHEGRVLSDVARKTGQICQAGTQCRSMKGTIDAINYIHAGKIGKVTVARGLCYKPRPSLGKLAAGTAPSTLDYNVWLGPAPMRPFHQNKFHYNWHWQWDTGNGDLGNQGIHQMDLARWGLNQKGFPKSVIGLGGRLGYEDDGATPNTHIAIMDYGDSQLIFETRGLPTGDYKGAKIGNVYHGTDGYVVLSNYTGGAAFDKDGNIVEKFNGAGDHFRNFIDCMRSRKAEDQAGPIEEGHVSSALCHLGNISYLRGEMVSFGQKPTSLADNQAAYETYQRFEEHLSANGVDMQHGQYRMGRKLMIDPARERFTNDPEANHLLTREYREGFVVPNKA